MNPAHTHARRAVGPAAADTLAEAIQLLGEATQQTARATQLLASLIHSQQSSAAPASPLTVRIQRKRPRSHSDERDSGLTALTAAADEREQHSMPPPPSPSSPASPASPPPPSPPAGYASPLHGSVLTPPLDEMAAWERSAVASVAIRRSSMEDAGDGVFALVDIPKHTRLLTYRGEALTRAHFEHRYAPNARGGATRNQSDWSRVMYQHADCYRDASRTDRRNVARFVNATRSTDPGCNCEHRYASATNTTTICTRRNVRAGDELLMSYGGVYTHYHLPRDEPRAAHSSAADSSAASSSSASPTLPPSVRRPPQAAASASPRQSDRRR